MSKKTFMEVLTLHRNITVSIENKIGRVWLYRTDANKNYLALYYIIEGEVDFECFLTFPNQNPDYHKLFEALEKPNTRIQMLPVQS